MWCKQCQQDVPAVPAAGTDTYSCPRCGVELCGGSTPPVSEVASAEPLPATDAPAQVSVPESHDPPSSQEMATESVIDPPFPAAPPLVTESVCVAESVFVAETASSIMGGDASPEQTPLDAVTDPPPSFDGWELDEELRHIQRILAVEKTAAAPARSPRDFYTRLDPGHRTPSRWVGRRGKAAVQRQDSEATTVGWLSALISIVLSTGLMAFAFGGVLLVWSFVTGRQDLWTFGMPIAMAGQIILLMGFILQMDRLWHDNRNAAAKLEHVDERLDSLRSTADRLGGSHRSPVPGNYGSPMAGSLDSQLMLADLKSQLDLLALKMGNQNDS
jgi:hypothetical protein